MWEFETTPQHPDAATAIQAVINGWGDNINFNADLFSDKGLGPVSGSSDVPFAYGLSSAGNPVRDSNDVAMTKFASARSIQPYAALDNVYPATTASPSSASGAAAVGGATVSFDSSDYLLRGAYTDTGPMSVGEGWRPITQPGTTGSEDFVGVVYVKADSGITRVDVELLDDIGSMAVTQFTVPATDTWYKVEVRGTSDPGATVVRMEITMGAGTGGQMWTDLHALYKTTARSTFELPFTDAAAVPATNLRYDISGIDFSHGFSWACWALGPAASLASNNDILYAGNTEQTSYLLARRVSGSTNFAAVVAHSPDIASVTETGVFDGAFHHLALTWAPGDGLMRVYVDGVEVGATIAVDLDTSELKILDVCVGGLFSSIPFEGYVDHFSIFPYRLHADQVAAMYNAPTAFPRMPKVRAVGDFAPSSANNPIIISGDAEPVDYKSVSFDGTFYHNARTVKFQLHEDVRA